MDHMIIQLRYIFLLMKCYWIHSVTSVILASSNLGSNSSKYVNASGDSFELELRLEIDRKCLTKNQPLVVVLSVRNAIV